MLICNCTCHLPPMPATANVRRFALSKQGAEQFEDTNKQTYLWVALQGGVASEKSVEMLTADANVPSYETMDHGQCQALPDREREGGQGRQREEIVGGQLALHAHLP